MVYAKCLAPYLAHSALKMLVPSSLSASSLLRIQEVMANLVWRPKLCPGLNWPHQIQMPQSPAVAATGFEAGTHILV